MDHRWDEHVRRDHATRREHERYDVSVVPRDPDVERRDRRILEERRHRVQRSPWEIGVEHYDQRDLYTRNARIDDGGYGLGPRVHPEEGSYAYVRADHDEPDADEPIVERWPNVHGRPFYQREAWPWIRYEDEAREAHDRRSREEARHEHEARHEDRARREDEARHEHEARTAPSHERGSRHEDGARREGSTLATVARRGGLGGPLDALHRWRTRLQGLVAGAWWGRRNEVERTDVVLRRDAYEALWRHRELDASDIEVFVVRGDVTLTGTVPDRPSKRLAESVIEPCRGVRKVHNRLRVRRDDPRAPFAMGLRAYD